MIVTTIGNKTAVTVSTNKTTVTSNVVINGGGGVGTVDIKNSEDTLLYSVDVASGDTENQVIPDQSAEGTTGQGAITFPANTTGTIPDNELTNTDGSTQSIPYGEPLVCQTMIEAIDNATAEEVVTAIVDADKECSVRRGLVDLLYNDGMYTIGEIGTISSLTIGCAINESNIYFGVNANINIYNTSDFTFVATISGFGRVAKIYLDAASYYISDLTDELIRTYDINTNLQSSSFATGFRPFAMSVIDNKIYTAPYNIGGGLRVFSKAGALLDTIIGFEDYVFDIKHDDTHYYVLHGEGTSGGSDVKVRKMLISDNSEVADVTVGTASTIGTPQGITLNFEKIYVSTSKSSGANILEFDIDISLLRISAIGVLATNSWGLCSYPNECNILMGAYGTLGCAKLIVI